MITPEKNELLHIIAVNALHRHGDDIVQALREFIETAADAGLLPDSITASQVLAVLAAAQDSKRAPFTLGRFRFVSTPPDNEL